MFVLYNMLQVILLPVFSPILLLIVISNQKYRTRIINRLGFGLSKQFVKTNNCTNQNTPSKPCYWIHALSVGEVTSAIPLVTEIKRSNPDSKIIFSVTTKSGRQVADTLLANLADHIIDGPLDLLPTIRHFFNKIQPDYFILVETDFWPNILSYLKNKDVPAILVNGRVSDNALKGYQRMRFFFYPLFNSFAGLCMQTEIDRKKIAALGVSPDKIHTLGNLKFDTTYHLDHKNIAVSQSIKKHLPFNDIIWIAGSTHAGEEEQLLESFSFIRKDCPNIFLVIAPRDPRRTDEIDSIARACHFRCTLRTESPNPESDILILNTIGELAGCYSLADISFVGGSLVSKGGHNPIEPAAMSIPVMFGPHMEDFSEIADDLIANGGATLVRNSQEIAAIVTNLIQNKNVRIQQGAAAKDCVDKQRGVIKKHLELLRSL